MYVWSDGSCLCVCVSVCLCVMQDGRGPGQRGLRGQARGRRPLEALPGRAAAAHPRTHRRQHIHPIHTRPGPGPGGGRTGPGDFTIRCGMLSLRHTHIMYVCMYVFMYVCMCMYTFF